MHFWIGHHRPYHQNYPHYQPSTYESGLTSPRSHGAGPTHQDSVVSTSGHVDTAGGGSVGVLKWGVLATVVFFGVFFLSTEIYKLHQESNYHAIAWILGSVSVMLGVVLVSYGISRYLLTMAPDNPPAEAQAASTPAAFV